MTETWASMLKPTSITLHPDTVAELLELQSVMALSLQDVMRECIRRAGQNGMALTVPPRVLEKRLGERTRKQKMLYLRAEECGVLWGVQRALDLNTSRSIEVCIHNAWLAYATK